MRLFSGLILAFCAACATAQGPLLDMKVPCCHRKELALILTDGALRGFDSYSTHAMLARGNHESFLPSLIADKAPVMTLYSGGFTMGQYWLGRKLIGHGHPKLAYVITAADISVTAPFAIRNLFLPSHKYSAPAALPMPPPARTPILECPDAR